MNECMSVQIVPSSSLNKLHSTVEGTLRSYGYGREGER